MSGPTAPVETVQLRCGIYQDSVALMQVSSAVAGAPGVSAALVAMATDLNLGVLRDMGFEPPDGASAADLLVALRGADDGAVAGALQLLETSLARASDGIGEGGGGVAPARTTGGAAVRAGATLALISVPGPFAFVEAMDALEAGLDVMVFSDNVPVEQEIRLKEEGGRRGLLVMGPDCGTALVNGVGLGFANTVRPGPVGIVAASGTGAQQLMCLLDAAGTGVSHCLGVGGRDLSSRVGGRSTLQAMALLDADAATELIVVVSKPPADGVAETVRAAAASLRTPAQLVFLGEDGLDLTSAAEAVVAAAGGDWTEPESWPASRQGPPYGVLRGLFAGGTLCDEAMAIAARTLGTLRSNIPLRPGWSLAEGLRGEGHVMIDFGDDALTRGRPHPMIDCRARLERLADEAQDPAVGAVLLDVVLGYGAHPDPRAELGPAISDARGAAAAAGRELTVVVSLCGTRADPQGLERQAAALSAAGASVHLSNAAATRAAVRAVAADEAGAPS